LKFNPYHLHHYRLHHPGTLSEIKISTDLPLLKSKITTQKVIFWIKSGSIQPNSRRNWIKVMAIIYKTTPIRSPGTAFEGEILVQATIFLHG
jgi:hypothetical protein